MIKEFTFVELPVKNLERAISFYKNTLRLQVSHMDEIRHWCLFKIHGSNTGCALYESTDESINVDCSVRIVVRVESLEETLETLEKQGVPTEPVRHHQEEHFRISGFRDPDGHVWRIWAPYDES